MAAGSTIWRPLGSESTPDVVLPPPRVAVQDRSGTGSKWIGFAQARQVAPGRRATSPGSHPMPRAHPVARHRPSGTPVAGRTPPGRGRLVGPPAVRVSPSLRPCHLRDRSAGPPLMMAVSLMRECGRRDDCPNPWPDIGGSSSSFGHVRQEHQYGPCQRVATALAMTRVTKFRSTGTLPTRKAAATNWCTCGLQTRPARDRVVTVAPQPAFHSTTRHAAVVSRCRRMRVSASQTYGCP